MDKIKNAFNQLPAKKGLVYMEHHVSTPVEGHAYPHEEAQVLHRCSVHCCEGSPIHVTWDAAVTWAKPLPQFNSPAGAWPQTQIGLATKLLVSNPKVLVCC